MKKIAFIALLSTLLFSCSKVKDGEFILEGEAKGIANGKKVVLHKQDDSLGMIPIDTTSVKDGKFTFKGKVKEPFMHLIQIEGINVETFYTILETGEIKMVIDKDSIQKTRISGTYNNDEMQSFTDKRNEFQATIKEFEYKNQSKLAIAQNENDQKTIKQLQADYAVLQKKLKDYVVKYIEGNPKSYISTLLIGSLFAEFEPDLQLIEKYYNGLDESLKNNTEGKKILKKLKEFKKVDVGKRAPDFSAKSPEGKVISLKETLGKVTIIDFWASWCAPCRQENPNVVALYNEFHAKGLNIIGVSLDEDATKWTEAIAKDGLTWTHVSNLKKWKDPIAVQYGINSIPKTFVLNSFGVVVAKDLSGKELRAKIEELLAAK
ncbi:redoxin domain-containing protein [Flavobacterium sp.]|uniref:redoxin domain-containing protein n=1 Tax=Flavobacterium sp. TaxID=239 RepID=UPI003750D14E